VCFGFQFKTCVVFFQVYSLQVQAEIRLQQMLKVKRRHQAGMKPLAFNQISPEFPQKLKIRLVNASFSDKSLVRCW